MFKRTKDRSDIEAADFSTWVDALSYWHNSGFRSEFMKSTTVKISRTLANKIDAWMKLPEIQESLKIRRMYNRTGALTYITIQELKSKGIIE